MSFANKLSISDVELAGKRVLIRVDFNVPMDGDKITNPQRIVAALPTIKYALEQSEWPDPSLRDSCDETLYGCKTFASSNIQNPPRCA